MGSLRLLGLDPDTHKYKRRKRQVEGTYEQAEAMRSWLKDPQAEIELPEDSLPKEPQDVDSGNKEIALAGTKGFVESVQEATALYATPACGYVPPSRFDARTPHENITLAELANIHARKKIAFGKWAKITEHAWAVASDEHFLTARNLKLAAERGLSSVDRENRSNVAVIGESIALELFGTTNCSGRR